MASRVIGEYTILGRCHVKSESGSQLSEVMTSISDACFSAAETMADFFHSIGQKVSVRYACETRGDSEHVRDTRCVQSLRSRGMRDVPSAASVQADSRRLASMLPIVSFWLFPVVECLNGLRKA